MPKLWTWLVMLVMTAGAVVLADQLGEPERASAQVDQDPAAGQSLTEPVPPKRVEGQTRVAALIGLKRAGARLKADLPTGRGILAGQVEAGPQGSYLADTAHKRLPGTGFVPQSGQGVVSGHATRVAVMAFGTGSAGQGVREVRAWAVADWLGPGLLNTRSSEPPASDHGVRVFNHSWVSGGRPSDPLVLRRVDYVIDTQDVVMVCGVQNQQGPPPPVLAQAYNVISVGVMDAPSSDGLTTVEGEGRCKPDLVAPRGKTSWASGVVTGCVAALLEAADRIVQADAEGPGQDAARSELIKALLMAGAWRRDNWSPMDGEPLDRAQGAGVVDLDRALVMLQAGPVEPGLETKQRYGWSFAQIKAGSQQDYRFVVDVDQGETGIALTWHRRVLGGQAKIVNNETGEERVIWNPAQFTPNLDLKLLRETDAGELEEIAISTSQVDNVELLHLKALEPGNYTLRVERFADDVKQAWDYALAWRIEAPSQRKLSGRPQGRGELPEAE